MKIPLKLAVIAAVLAVSGCIKDSHPPIPEPPKNPGWLITKWVQLEVYEQFFPDPSGPPNWIIKQESVIEYNKYYKPEVQRYYNSEVNDTAKLRLTRIDSIFYDGQHRVAEVRVYDNSGLLLQRTVKYEYAGADTMPSATSSLTVNDGSVYRRRFIYLPEDVLSISTNEKTGKEDTTRSVFENGNYMRAVNPDGSVYEAYLDYTSAPNPRLRFNIPHGGVIGMPFMHESAMRLSRNHHGEKPWYGISVNAFVDSRGLVSGVWLTDPYTIGNKYWAIRYEYSDDVTK